LAVRPEAVVCPHRTHDGDRSQVPCQARPAGGLSPARPASVAAGQHAPRGARRSHLPSDDHAHHVQRQTAGERVDGRAFGSKVTQVRNLRRVSGRPPGETLVMLVRLMARTVRSGILVGYDGSPESIRALDWAVLEAPTPRRPAGDCTAAPRAAPDAIAPARQSCPSARRSTGGRWSRPLGRSCLARPLPGPTPWEYRKRWRGDLRCARRSWCWAATSVV
jgi:hypothetical protein